MDPRDNERGNQRADAAGVAAASQSDASAPPPLHSEPAVNSAAEPLSSTAGQVPPARAAKGSGRSRGLLPATFLSKEAHDRLAIFAVRAVFFFVSAGIGVAAIRVLTEVTPRKELDPVMGILVACGTAFLLILLEATLVQRSPIRTISAITFGLVMGLAMSLVFQFVVEFIVSAVTSSVWRVEHGEMLLAFLKLVTTTIFCYFGVTTLLRTKEDFKFIIPYVEFQRELRGETPLVLDTSSFIDGRIQGLCQAGVFDQRLVVPKFVLAELQRIADSADRSLRERGRRGLDILQEIQRDHFLEIVDQPLNAGEAVDAALIVSAARLSGRLVTTDFNLEKNARLQGVRVLNLNDIASVMKPSFVPGETLKVQLLREGEDRGQGVGFLRDGTMVVVEGGRARIGQEVMVEVTSSLQTNAGKMVFGKLRRGARGEGEA
jgi:uncharacterized protein YacL